MSGPYDRAEEYRKLGWTGTLPLPLGAKTPPPSGFTGGQGAMPTTDNLHAWRTTGYVVRGDDGKLVKHFPGNIALRLPPIAVGLDVDAYDDKPGAATLAAREAQWGPLPPTWRSTSRDDGVSGIRFFRIPTGLSWPNVAGPGIEIIRHGHRYAVAWPSLHPDGGLYQWLDPDGATCGIPAFADLPDLPTEWITGLTGGMAEEDRPSSLAAGRGERKAGRTWLAQLPAGEPCPFVGQRAADALAAARRENGNAYDHTRDAVLSLLRAGETGHPGVPTVLAAIRQVYVDTVHGDRPGGRTVAEGEFDRFTEGGAALILTEPGERAGRGCDCTRTVQGNGFTGIAAWDSRDPHDLIATNGNLATVHQLPAAAQAAQPAAEPARKLVLTPASAIKPRRVRWLWDGRIALGSLSLLAGGEGLGKSTLGYTVAADVTRGTLEGEFHGDSRAILVCASEDSWEYTIIPRLMAANADLDKVFRVEVQTADDITVGLSLPRDLADVEAAAMQVGAALMILDPLMSRLSESIDTHKDGEVRRALEPMVALADRASMAILGLIHHNKSGSADPMQRVMASKAFTAVARSVHTVIVDPDDENEQRRLFGTPKNNLGRTDLPTLAFTIVGHPIQTDEGPTSTGRLVWAGEVDGSIGDAMKRALGSDDERTAGSEAADWLTDYLQSKGGTDDSATIKREGLKAGHSQDALKRARKKIKAEIDSRGFPRRTFWSLPGTQPTTPDRPFMQPPPVGAPVGAAPRGDTPTALTAPTEAQSVQSVQSEQSEQAPETPPPLALDTPPKSGWPTGSIGEEMNDPTVTTKDLA